MPRMILAALVALAALSTTGIAQNAGHAHGAEAPAPHPTEPGQGAFAAIAEIVAILAADPATQWEKVDIAGLRDHLVDMDNLVTHTSVTERPIAGGLEISIDASTATGDAARRMVPAHSGILRAETGWQSEVREKGSTLVWSVTSANDAERIRALGFFGLMATGDHHRAHHLALARGTQPH